MPTETRNHSIHVRDRGQMWAPRTSPLIKDNLFNEMTFYPAFTKDVLAAKREVIIYSPFVSKYRSDTFNRLVYKLGSSNVDLFIFTRPVEEYDREQQESVRKVLDRYEELGANVYFLKGSIHEKVAIIDREILWEGSLNILSQRTSREMMRRLDDEDMSLQIIRYLGLGRLLAEGYKQKYERLYRSLMEDEKRVRRLSPRTTAIALAGMAIVLWILTALLAMIPMNGVYTILTVVRVLTSH